MLFISSILPAGFVYGLKWVLSYLYIRLKRALRPKRFDFFDYGAVNQPERSGFLSPEIEIKLESPFPESHLLEAEDKVLCYGMTSQSDRLVASVTRLIGEKAEACVYLRLANGKTYRLTECSGHQQPTGDPRVFSCGGLQMHSLCPMRRWRIFFSGFLSETSEEDPCSDRMVYVRFAFLWRASSNLFDYSADIDAKLLSDGLARAQWGSPLPPLHKLEKAFDAYSQMGVILGTVSVDGEEERELYLFGERMRILGTTAYPDFTFTHNLGYVHRDGTFVHFGRASLPNVVNDLHFGFIVQPDVDMKPTKGVTIRPSAADSDVRADLQTIHTYNWSGSANPPRLKVSGDLSDVESSVNILHFYMNGHRGSGVQLKGHIRSGSRRKTPAARPPKESKAAPIVVPFSDAACQEPELTGGKGSSLGKLTSLGGQLKNFVVPSGIVVTTSAYQRFVTPDIALAIEQLEDVLYGRVPGVVKEACNKVGEKMIQAKMPDNVRESILQVLKKHFGHKIRIRKFAVRSSATGEDTEQMSAAGQMDTFLGISGLENILLAVKKCWASQFGYIAVEYKRRYGQAVNSPMAVVIQEMVPCDVAGVMFTCDPLTGNPTVMIITANYGLGETVVSGSEEPDSIELSRNYKDDLGMKNKTIGAKGRKIIVTDAEGATLEDVPEHERMECCLSDEMALRLGRIGVQIEKHYRSRRDIEFGFWSNNLYIFQSRPVTSGTQETDFEIEHEFDAPLRIENEYFSMSNIGEVLPGAMTPLGYEVFFRTLSPVWNGKKLIEWQSDIPVRYFPLVWVTISMRGMIDVPDMFRKADKGNNDPFTSASMVAFMGRMVDDDELSQILQDRYAQSDAKHYPWEAPYRLAKSLLWSGHLLAQTRRKFLDYRVPIERYRTAEELFEALALRCSDLLEPVSRHLSCTQGSSMWNLFILMTLQKAEGAMDEGVFRDFSTLVTTCSDVESADVPAAIQSLAYHISRATKPEEFKNLDAEEALQWLRNSSSTAGVKFRDFLDKHGHRCLKEFDIYSIPWGTDPKPLVRLLQNLALHVRGDSIEKKASTFDDLVSQLNVPLGHLTKLKLRFLLHMAKRAVQQREGSKSLWVRMIDALRRGYRQLAKLMVSEGRIPDEDILFFMSLEEVRELLLTRSPKILAKARHRQRLHPELDKYIFPELMRGFPKPINCDESPVIETDEAMTMKGIPVSQGVARGYVRVALSLDDASHLQPGEILLAFSTDIGWTPYFPMLAGVVTELGGLISHGAVVSREYGIPCIAGLHGATRRFQTGDYVLLDGNKGILTKIPPPQSGD